MGYRFELAARNAAIHQARAEGATDADLVRQFHLCPRTIYNVLKTPPRYLATLQADPDSPTATQLRLF
jgi:Mor family transcriptional regulator